MLGCVQWQGGHSAQRRKAARRNCRGETWLQSTFKLRRSRPGSRLPRPAPAAGRSARMCSDTATPLRRCTAASCRARGCTDQQCRRYGNLISIKTGYSLGVYDVEKLEGDILWTATGAGVHYQGIGKDAVNIGVPAGAPGMRSATLATPTATPLAP